MTRLNSIRIIPPNWNDEYRFKKLLSMLDKYPCGIGEIAFFTAFSHAPLTLEETKKRLETIEKRMIDARSAGYKAGINILATIGHHNEDLENSLKGYTNMTGIDGNVCHGSFCMNDQKFLEEYVVPVYQMLARTNPDFIWIDDDVRYYHMPVGYGCFCDNCIKIFNETNGTSYTREELKRELNDGNKEIRKAFLKKNSDAICNLFELIGKTVREVSDKIKLGFMTGDRFFEGYEFKRYSAALSDNGKYEIMWRPGGGAYQDRCFDEIIEKVCSVGRQCAYLPEYVTSIQSEIENFPYDIIQKSPHSTSREILLHIATGCTGAALNILPGATEDPVCDEPLESIEKHLKKINETYGFQEMLSEKLKNLNPCGIHTGWNISSQAATTGEDWTNTFPDIEFGQYASELLDMGFPQAYRTDKAQVMLLTKKAASVMTNDEITEILSGGVYMDADALEYLNSIGYEKYTGFKTEKEYPVDAHERYTHDPINKDIADGVRNCRQSFYPGESYGLTPTNENARILANLVDYHREPMAECAMGIFENSLGGRVCVAGYYPFKRISFYQKSLQLKRVFEYLSKGNFVGYIKSHVKARLWTYTGENKSYMVIFNVTNDTYENVEISVNTDATTAIVYTKQPYDFKTVEIKENTLTLSSLAPFELTFIEF